MSADGPPSEGPSARVPAADELTAVDPDGWARLLVHVRRALHDLDEEELTPRLRRLRASPTSRLAGGHVRRELAVAVAEGGGLWRALHARLGEAELPDRLEWLVAGRPPGDGGEPRAEPSGPQATDRAAARRLAEERDRLRERLGELRDAHEDARRRAEGSQARAETLEAKLEEARRELTEERARSAELREEVDEARRSRRQAVERERRRHLSRIEELEEQLSAHRRREQERRRARRREQRADAEGDSGAESGAGSGTGDGSAPSTGGGRPLATPGRPSRLPDGLRPDTAEGARALMTPGRRVLIDGYNVTLTQRPGLDLTWQRTWLVRMADQAAARFEVRPELIFDGEVGVGDHPGVRHRVSVRFSSPPVTADDEIVFLVEAAEPDEPILVVTDDRELSDRVAERDVDVVGTGPFCWALG